MARMHAPTRTWHSRHALHIYLTQPCLSRMRRHARLLSLLPLRTGKAVVHSKPTAQRRAGGGEGLGSRGAITSFSCDPFHTSPPLSPSRYPVSALKGDGQSKGLINAWLNSPVAKGVFKDRLDEGMARTIFESERRLGDMAAEQYPQLREQKARLQYGFKILSKDVQ